MRQTVLGTGFSLLILGWGPLSWAGPSFVVEGPTLLDAHGRRTVDTLVVIDGVIAHAGPSRDEDQGLERVNAHGHTLVPGLIDAHVHLSMQPGAAFTNRTAAEVRDRQAHHLRAYVASGVVAVLDTGIPIDAVPDLLSLAQRGPSPQIALLGPLVSPPGGYVHQVIPEFPPATDPESLTEQLEAFDSFHPIGVKVTMEDGLVNPIWPLHDPSILNALAAQQRPLFVHAFEKSEYTTALENLPVRAFVHPPDRPMPDLVSELQDIPIVTTISVYESLLLSLEKGRLDDPLLRLVVPDDELAAAGHRATQRASTKAMTRTTLPRMLPPLRGVARALLRNRSLIRARVNRMNRSLRLLHSSGIELVLGSDSGNWPILLTEFHGPTTVREFELILEADIPFADALTIATLNGARLLELEDELGTLEVGKRASFLILDTDPKADPSVLRRPRNVVLDGVIRTPEEWMSAEPTSE